MSERVKVDANDSLERDVFSSAILNNDANAYISARNRKKKAIQTENTINELKAKLEELLAWKSQVENILNKNVINTINDG
jgi:hypothetical protein